MDAYCGKCHKWLDSNLPDDAVCRCASPDLTKDPNCHNSGHAHYDPESPIVQMDRQVAALEDAIDAGLAHEWLTYPRGQYCIYCDVGADKLEGDAWVYCPARPGLPPEPEHPLPPDIQYQGRPLDEGYDAKRINWPRLMERVLASVINAIFYGTLLVVAKALGLL